MNKEKILLEKYLDMSQLNEAKLEVDKLFSPLIDHLNMNLRSVKYRAEAVLQELKRKKDFPISKIEMSYVNNGFDLWIEIVKDDSFKENVEKLMDYLEKRDREILPTKDGILVVLARDFNEFIARHAPTKHVKVDISL